MKHKILKLVGRIALIVLAALLFGVGVYNINAKALVGDAMPMPLGISASVVLSGSMEPELSINDLIIVKKTDVFYEEQVVVFQDGGSLTVHRIKEINGDEIVTKGDANNTKDDPISREMIKGEVVLAIPYVGLLVRILKNPIVTVLLIGLALFLIERSYRKEKCEKNGELDSLKEEIKKLEDELKK